MSIGPRNIIDITARNAGQVPSWNHSPNEFIVVHYLGVDGQNPDLYGGGYGGHYNIFWDGTIYCAADPSKATVWQCGGGRQGYDPGSGKYFGVCTNYNSIGIECSVHYDGTWYFTTETQESLVWLVSYLMDKYNIPIDHVIRHWDVTGKHCPAPYVENTGYKTNWTWDEFKKKLADYRGGHTEGDDELITEVFAKARIKTIYSNQKYRKVVNIDKGDRLNVRLAPDASAPKNPYWPQLALGNDCRETCRYTNGWSSIIIDLGAGKSTQGYVKSSYLK